MEEEGWALLHFLGLPVFHWVGAAQVHSPVGHEDAQVMVLSPACGWRLLRLWVLFGVTEASGAGTEPGKAPPPRLPPCPLLVSERHPHRIARQVAWEPGLLSVFSGLPSSGPNHLAGNRTEVT